MKTRALNKINKKSLLKYGFIQEDNIYYYEKDIMNNKFKVQTFIDNNTLNSKVIDNLTNEEYFLVDVDGATGAFVGQIKEEYENILLDIINSCTTKDLYEYSQTSDVLKYIKKTYHDNPEFLWKSDPRCGAIRNKTNNKWYALIMPLNKNKLNFNEDTYIEILDIRYQKDKCDEIVNYTNILPGYHMNKKSWITIILDGSLNNEIIYSLIDNSYSLSLQK